MKMKSSILLLMAFSVIMTGCASSKMTPVTGGGEIYKPRENEATIIFMRPSFFGAAIQSSVFDVTTAENKFVGIVSAFSKVAYKTSPGVHLFMVVGESGDFLRVKFAAGKTYYAVVIPRLGFLKARFSLSPVRRHEMESGKFKDEIEDKNFVENTPESHAWARENGKSIQDKREEYWPKWIRKYGENSYGLSPEDGS